MDDSEADSEHRILTGAAKARRGLKDSDKPFKDYPPRGSLEGTVRVSEVQVSTQSVCGRCASAELQILVACNVSIRTGPHSLVYMQSGAAGARSGMSTTQRRPVNDTPQDQSSG